MGAGLPAKGPAHPASASPDTPPSLASPLLQGDYSQAADPGNTHKGRDSFKSIA